MKQHITEEQYFELSQDDRNKLDDWYVKTYFEEGRFYTDVFPYLTIGEMIEFLEHNKKSIGCFKRTDEGSIVKYNNRKEICDNLWEAVKEVL